MKSVHLARPGFDLGSMCELASVALLGVLIALPLSTTLAADASGQQLLSGKRKRRQRLSICSTV